MIIDPLFSPIIILGIAWLVVVIRLWTLLRLAQEPHFQQKNAVFRGLSVLRWWNVTLAIVCLVITAYRPIYTKNYLTSEEVGNSEQKENLFLVIDSTPSMKTQDFGHKETRIDRVRQDVLDIIVSHPKAHISVITYGSSARLDWPLTQDVWSLTQFARSLAAYDTTTYSDMQSADPWEAAKFLQAEIITQYRIDPLSTNWVYFFTDGDPFTVHPTDQDSNVKYSRIPYISGGLALMYGTEKGGNVIAFTVANKPMLVDSPEGTLVVKNNPALLHAIAHQMGLHYIDRSVNNLSIDSLVTENMQHPHNIRTQPGNRQYSLPLYWILALISGVLLSIEFIIVVFTSPVLPRLLSPKDKSKQRNKP